MFYSSTRSKRHYNGVHIVQNKMFVFSNTKRCAIIESMVKQCFDEN